MIGNDVVDLKAAAAESNWRRKGFLEKVFSRKEREMISGARDRHQIVWLLWSMKEAAYKARQREFNLPRSLNWKALQCEIYQISSMEASGAVKVHEKQYFTASKITSEVVHTSASNNFRIPVKKALFETSSAAVKKELLQQTAEYFCITSEALSFRKNYHGVPYISYKNREFFSRFSFSDHGRFSAFSLSLRMS